MKELLKKFEHKTPEIIFEWKDPETEAKGWIVINSLRNGAAGGGTRMRVGLDRREVESLAKTMEIKFTISGPPIGGAKSGISFDPKDPRKKGVLERWYKAVYPILKNYYGTGGDLNIDEIQEVIPITENYGLWHPQEGIVNGYFGTSEAGGIKKIGRLRQGVSKVLENPNYTPTIIANAPIEKKYTVADMITGFGVSESIRIYYEKWGGNISQKKAIIQGWGNVGATVALYLAKMGVKIGGIIDKDGGLISEEGYDLESIKKLFVERIGNRLVAQNLLSFEEINEKIWSIGAEIFIPAAASRLITKMQAEKMIANNLEVMASGANVPCADKEIFYGPIMEYMDKHISFIPDFIANCGMARVFAYLMSKGAEVTDEAIFSDTTQAIEDAIEKVHQINPQKTLIASSAFKIALEQLL